MLRINIETLKARRGARPAAGARRRRKAWRWPCTGPRSRSGLVWFGFEPCTGPRSRFCLVCSVGLVWLVLNFAQDPGVGRVWFGHLGRFDQISAFESES